MVACTIRVGKMSYGLNKTLQMCTLKTESGLGYKSSQVRVRVRVQQPPLQVQVQLNSVAKLINSLKVPINMLFFFQIKSTQLRRLLTKPMRRCSSKCNVSSTVSTPLSLLGLKPNTHGLRPREHAYELPECRLQLRKKIVHYPVSIQIRMMTARFCIVLCK